MKLLAKTPEDRYQTAAGVDADLRRCLTPHQQAIASSLLLWRRTTSRMSSMIPEKLYGREQSIQTLLAAFDRVATEGRPELMLVSGYSGIGKSAVVNELQKVLSRSRRIFAAGKCDQFKRDIPYATLAQALQGLVQMILRSSEAELVRWRDAIRRAVEPNGQLIASLVPELELVIGKQPPVPGLATARLAQPLSAGVSRVSSTCSPDPSTRSCSSSTTCNGSMARHWLWSRV